MSEAALAPAPPLVAAAPVRRRSVPLRPALAVGAALVLAGAGAAWIAAPKASVSTEDAYLRADATTVAPKVRGLVAEVLVRDNQPVHRGDPLVRIDGEEFDARAAAAAADLSTAQAAADSARAALTSLATEERLADSGVRSAQTAISAADAQSLRALADRRRNDALVADGAVSQREADQARAAAAGAQAEAAHSRAELAVSRDRSSVVRARRAGLTAAVAQADAAVARARAALDLARQDQRNTVIRAAVDGVVGDRQAQAGDYVQPGSRLLTLVPLHALYVVANFKETQTARMLAGQPVEVTVDALPGRRLRGRVESFAPGSGSQFSLLPFEPGTGNFTKIVQRVPVRIRLDPGQPYATSLRPGLSVTAKVDLRS